MASIFGIDSTEVNQKLFPSGNTNDFATGAGGQLSEANLLLITEVMEDRLKGYLPNHLRDMLDHIELRRHTVGLAGLYVASADGQAFRTLAEDVAAEGVPVTVLGFREHASWAVTSEVISFVDLEDIAGVFREPLPRINLDSLPDEGAWLAPFRPLSALLSGRNQG